MGIHLQFAQQLASALPAPVQLAALGSVLCVYRNDSADPLSGWQCAQHACARCGIDSDGIDETLLCFDPQGRCCWQLYLLPDADFLAWDAMCADLQCIESSPCRAPAPSVCMRLWQRIHASFCQPAWQASVLRLHAPMPHRQADIGPVLASSVIATESLSAIGQHTVARLLKRLGIAALSSAPEALICLSHSLRREGTDAQASQWLPST